MGLESIEGKHHILEGIKRPSIYHLIKMTHNDLPQDPTVTPETDLQPSKADKPKKNSNMRSRWKKSSHGQSKTPSASSPTFGIVEQPAVSPKAERKTENTETKAVEPSEKPSRTHETAEKDVEAPSAPQKTPRPRMREEHTETPRRFSRTAENNPQKPYTTRSSFNRPPLRREQAPKTHTKNNMDYEPSRASFQKKQSLDEAILKSQETSLWAKIKQFFIGLFSNEKVEAKKEPRPTSSRYGQRSFPGNKKPYYSRNYSRGRKEP